MYSTGDSPRDKQYCWLKLSNSLTSKLLRIPNFKKKKG